ncbi:MAG: pyridoxal phosphate-dependent aminotransferase [Actinomycetota bacterium]|jgi:aspartate aminotransferase|nr:pyridoxal phosphate-dependent aminotransferase [Actinomycetota bacterium]
MQPESTIKFAERILKVEESPTFALEKKADQLDVQLKKEGKSIIRFGIGQPDFDTPLNIKEAGKAAIDDNKTRYTASTGIKELKQAVAEKFKKENNLDYDIENILIGNGAKHILDDIMRVMLDPGDKVIIPRPYWVSYSQQVILSEGMPLLVDFNQDLKINLESLKNIIDSNQRIKLFILNSPNNPTGAVNSRQELEEIGKLCLENQIIIISDEVYEKFLYGNTRHYSLASFSPELKAATITLNAVSKTYAMTGWRIGYCAADKEIIAQMTKVHDQSTSNPCSIAQWAAMEALQGDQDSVQQMKDEYEKRRDYIYQRLTAMEGINCSLPEGAFYIFPDVSPLYGKDIKNSFDFAHQLLEKASVAVVPGGAFGADDYIRISYATALDKIEEGMDRMEVFCRELI